MNTVPRTLGRFWHFDSSPFGFGGLLWGWGRSLGPLGLACVAFVPWHIEKVSQLCFRSLAHLGL